MLQTANFAGNAKAEFDMLLSLQPGRPLMSMEYWSGWFDHWTESHHTRTTANFKKELKAILDYPASVNMYMFHGGTSFGFTNGANMADSSTDNGGLQPDTTSYDYDAPLSEAGDYTKKYEAVYELLQTYNKIKTKLPERPAEIPKIEYPSLNITHFQPFASVIAEVNFLFFDYRWRERVFFALWLDLSDRLLPLRVVLGYSMRTSMTDFLYEGKDLGWA